MEVKDRYDALIVSYKEKEKKVVELLAQKKVAEEEQQKIRDKIQKLIKSSPADLDKVIEKLEKSIEVEFNALSNKVLELEDAIGDIQAGEKVKSTDSIDINSLIEEV